MRLQLSEAEAVKRPCDEARDSRKREVEPVGLIEMGLQVEPEGGPFLVPDAVVVAGHASKRILARRDARVISHTPAVCLDPILVEPFELILESDFFGGHETQARVLKL